MKHPGIALALTSAFVVASVPGFQAHSSAAQVPQVVSWEARLGWARDYLVGAAADARVGNLSAFNGVFSRMLKTKHTDVARADADAPGEQVAIECLSRESHCLRHRRVPDYFAGRTKGIP